MNANLLLWGAIVGFFLLFVLGDSPAPPPVKATGFGILTYIIIALVVLWFIYG